MPPSAFQAFKLELVALLGLSKDALHIGVGLAVLFVAAWVLRRRVGSLPPLLVVLAAAVAGEALDLRDDLATLGIWRWRASLHDLLNTLFWPAVVTLLARTRLFTARR